MRGGVEVYRAEAAFEADGQQYAAGTFVIPMTQVFARYAKDLLEKQTYPEVRRNQNEPPEPPYDVTAWSLGMLFGVDVDVHQDAAAGDAADDATHESAGGAGPGGRQRSAIHLRVLRRRTRRSRSTAC